MSSTHELHLFSTRNPSVQNRKLLTSTHKSLSFTPKALSSTPKNHRFYISLSSTHPSVPHLKPLSSTPKPPHFHTLLCWEFFGVELRGLAVELRAFWCGTEVFLLLDWGVLVWNWGILEAEKEWPFSVELMCWTKGATELIGTHISIIINLFTARSED